MCAHVQDEVTTARAGPWEPQRANLVNMQMVCLPCPPCPEPVSVTCLGGHEVSSLLLPTHCRNISILTVFYLLRIVYKTSVLSTLLCGHPNSKTKRRIKTKIGAKVPQGRSNSNNNNSNSYDNVYDAVIVAVHCH